jgi:hypothetical protein
VYGDYDESPSRFQHPKNFPRVRLEGGKVALVEVGYGDIEATVAKEAQVYLFTSLMCSEIGRSKILLDKRWGLAYRRVG